ncbi:MAG: hypothetical protein HUJ65_00655 [Oscillospiraceae bacterium]|nr:hypothetical protein [Oscillospiraceae bacterium]
MKKKLIIAAVVVALLAVGTGAVILATGSGYGSQSDPLITLSYLNETLKPEIESKVSEAVSSESSAYSQKVDDMITEYQSSVTGEKSGDVFVYAVVPNGSTLTCDAGTELMLRAGSCTVYGSGSAVMSDTTSGETLGSGASVSTNHLCLVTASGGGVTAVGVDAELLIRGAFTIE